jgi:hypothetical protein
MSSPNEETARLQSDGSKSILLAEDNSSISRIGHTVDAVLEDLVWKLIDGQLGLQDFSPAFQLMWCLAADQGRASANRDEIERLTYERDLWYYVANNPGKRPRDFHRAHTDALWSERTGTFPSEVAA